MVAMPTQDSTLVMFFSTIVIFSLLFLFWDDIKKYFKDDEDEKTTVTDTDTATPITNTDCVYSTTSETGICGLDPTKINQRKVTTKVDTPQSGTGITCQRAYQDGIYGKNNKYDMDPTTYEAFTWETCDQDCMYEAPTANGWETRCENHTGIPVEEVECDVGANILQVQRLDRITEKSGTGRTCQNALDDLKITYSNSTINAVENIATIRRPYEYTQAQLDAINSAAVAAANAVAAEAETLRKLKEEQRLITWNKRQPLMFEFKDTDGKNMIWAPAPNTYYKNIDFNDTYNWAQLAGGAQKALLCKRDYENLSSQCQKCFNKDVGPTSADCSTCVNSKVCVIYDSNDNKVIPEFGDDLSSVNVLQDGLNGYNPGSGYVRLTNTDDTVGWSFSEEKKLPRTLNVRTAKKMNWKDNVSVIKLNTPDFNNTPNGEFQIRVANQSNIVMNIESGNEVNKVITQDLSKVEWPMSPEEFSNLSSSRNVKQFGYFRGGLDGSVNNETIKSPDGGNTLWNNYVTLLPGYYQPLNTLGCTPHVPEYGICNYATAGVNRSDNWNDSIEKGSPVNRIA
jgi:hypothetical protein